MCSNQHQRDSRSKQAPKWVPNKSFLSAWSWSERDSGLSTVDYEVISVNPFWLEPHSNRTALSALFYSQRSDCCCIYNWPAINASSGRLAITNGSPSIESPLWSWRHWREVYLVDRIDQRVVVLYLFIYLRSVQEKKEDDQFPRGAFHRLHICLWLVGEDARLQTLDCSESFGENCCAPIEPWKWIVWSIFTIDFGFLSKTSRKNLASRTNITLRIERAPQQWPSVWNSSWSLLIRNDPPSYLLTIVSGALGLLHSKKNLIAPHRKVNFYLRRKWYYKKTGLKWDGNFWNIIDLVSKRHKASTQAAGRRARSCSAHETWPPEMTVVYGGSLPFGHCRSSNVHFSSASVSVQQLLCWWIERQLQPDVRVLPRADKVPEESAQF